MHCQSGHWLMCVDSGTPYPEFVTVFAGEYPLACRVCEVVPHGGDVDEHPAVHVDPPRINDVEIVGLLPVDIVWVHLQQVASPLLNLGFLEMKGRHVVIGGEKLYARLGHLHVDIAVPGQDLQIVSLIFVSEENIGYDEPSDPTTSPAETRA